MSTDTIRQFKVRLDGAISYLEVSLLLSVSQSNRRMFDWLLPLNIPPTTCDSAELAKSTKLCPVPVQWFSASKPERASACTR